jgi:hypothetical protein
MNKVPLLKIVTPVDVRKASWNRQLKKRSQCRLYICNIQGRSQGFNHTVGGGDLSPAWIWHGGDIPDKLFFLNFSGFWKFNNFKCNFKAFRSRIKHFKVPKPLQGGYFHSKERKKLILILLTPTFFWRKPWQCSPTFIVLTMSMTLLQGSGQLFLFYPPLKFISDGKPIQISLLQNVLSRVISRAVSVARGSYL